MAFNNQTIGDDPGITSTWAPVITFTTPGDVSVSYAAQTGRDVKMDGLFLSILSLPSRQHSPQPQDRF